jgi:hypothetical protein
MQIAQGKRVIEKEIERVEHLQSRHGLGARMGSYQRAQQQPAQQGRKVCSF